MNTPAHIIFSLLILGPSRAAQYALAIALGALLPDATMILFYGYQKLMGVSESVIWNEKYFEPLWQNIFDIPNSIPLIMIAIAATWKLQRPWWTMLLVSMLNKSAAPTMYVPLLRPSRAMVNSCEGDCVIV